MTIHRGKSKHTGRYASLDPVKNLKTKNVLGPKLSENLFTILLVFLVFNSD